MSTLGSARSGNDLGLVVLIAVPKIKNAGGGPVVWDSPSLYSFSADCTFEPAWIARRTGADGRGGI